MVCLWQLNRCEMDVNEGQYEFMEDLFYLRKAIAVKNLALNARKKV